MVRSVEAVGWWLNPLLLGLETHDLLNLLTIIHGTLYTGYNERLGRNIWAG